ncbi:MAG: tRNA adenosine(34) deaminase TadA [Clostridia bacterium]|nr:tRNA adenosine(34) deaminase TadA [Clostridia bacterium]
MKGKRTDEDFMRIALQEAEKAYAADEVPIGAVIVKDGVVIARAHNEKEKRNSAVRHAEIVAIEKATKKVGNWWLEGCSLYVTLEPCAMCAGAIVNSRLDRVVYGAPDLRYGFLGSLADLPADYPLNHRPQETRGVLAEECGALLTSFFRGKREQKKKN